MSISFRLLKAPAFEPVSLALLKQQCNVDPNNADDDALIAAYAVAARQFAEQYTRRAFYPQQWLATLDHFPVALFSETVNPSLRRDWMFYGGVYGGMTIALPRPRCLSVDSITYLDQANVLQAVAASDFTVDLNGEPARILPAPGLVWPTSTLYQPGSVRVAFTAASYADLAEPESFSVPAQAPYAYAPQSWVAGIVSLVDGDGKSVSYSVSDGQLVFSAAQAGTTCTLTYYADSMPQTIKQAIMLLASTWYSFREGANVASPKEIPFGVSALLDLHTFTCFDVESVV